MDVGPLSVLGLRDQGERDEKIVAVLLDGPRTSRASRSRPDQAR
jgi:inorganic pyrophosphatase